MSERASFSNPASGSQSGLARSPRNLGVRRLPARLGLPAAVSLTGLLPGLLLTFAIAGLAYLLRGMPGVGIFSPLIIAIILGMLFRNVLGTPAQCQAGVTFSLKRILRFAIILLGLQLTVGQVIAVGGPGVLIIATTLAATFLFTTWLGRALGVDRKLTQLIAAGTSICGASAVIATNTVTKGSDEDVAYAVACVTLFGSLSMFLYPVLPALLHLDPQAYGLWSGASIHEIAQVVAAAFQNGKESGDFGTIAKLSRVILLAPLVLTLGWAARARAPRGESSGAVPMPWFVLGFVALMLFNSLDLLPAGGKAYVVQATTFLLTVAHAAMGLQADIRKLKAKGLKPLLVGAGAWLFIAAFSLGLIEIMY